MTVLRSCLDCSFAGEIVSVPGIILSVMKLICQNKRAYHDYLVLEKLEAGIALTGTEVKSCRANGMSLAQAYIAVDTAGNAKLIGCNIAPYAMGSYNNHVPTRERQLLLHKREIARLKRSTEAKGLTIIPLDSYFNPKGNIKLTIGICRGKNVHDKRDSLKADMDRRETERVIKSLK